MSYKYFDCMTGSMVSTVMNTPLEPDDPRLAATKHRPIDMEAFRPRGVTVTGNNTPSSYADLTKPIHENLQPVMPDWQSWTPTAATPPQPRASDRQTYETELAALRLKYGRDEPDNSPTPVSNDPQHQPDDPDPAA
jgi:hypothetical protein